MFAYANLSVCYVGTLRQYIRISRKKCSLLNRLFRPCSYTAFQITPLSGERGYEKLATGKRRYAAHVHLGIVTTVVLSEGDANGALQLRPSVAHLWTKIRIQFIIEGGGGERGLQGKQKEYFLYSSVEGWYSNYANASVAIVQNLLMTLVLRQRTNNRNARILVTVNSTLMTPLPVIRGDFYSYLGKDRNVSKFFKDILIKTFRISFIPF